LHPLEAPGFAWRTEAFRDVEFERIVRSVPNRGEDGALWLPTTTSPLPRALATPL